MVRSAGDGGPYHDRLPERVGRTAAVTTWLGTCSIGTALVGSTVPGRPRVQSEMSIGPVGAPLRGRPRGGEAESERQCGPPGTADPTIIVPLP